jgi:L-2-hydroxyglutarate oxidase LhgO
MSLAILVFTLAPQMYGINFLEPPPQFSHFEPKVSVKPNPINPFLGVHTTNTLSDEIKIGPTAFPVIGKEQYKFLDGFNAKELRDFYLATKTLLKSDSVNILGLAKSEGIKLFKRPLIKKAKRLTNALDLNQKWKN